MASKSKASETVLSARDAALIAANYVKALIRETHDILIEEVEYESKAGRWFITLSFYVGVMAMGRRDYKIFTLDAKSGEVLSMKIREV
jgi:hypothetical protein